jgi:Kef-type K+ transport system membrane component KefB
MMAQLLALGLGKINQPKVIAEVLGGILLGQSILYFILTPSLTQLQVLLPLDESPVLHSISSPPRPFPTFP